MHLSIDPIEAMVLRQGITKQQLSFVASMAQIYCAKPLKGDEHNFYEFLASIFNAGHVDGIRTERNRRKE